MDLSHNYDRGVDSDEEADAAETPAEARVRLAKMYLQGLSSSNAAGVANDGDDFFESDDAPTFGLADAAQADRDIIAARLQKDVAEQSGKIHLFLGDRIVSPSTQTDSFSTDSNLLAVRGHRLSVTCAVASSDAKWLFTASKDGSIIRWRLRDGKMICILPKRPTRFDESGHPLPPTSTNKSKTSGAARRRARLSTSSSSSKGKSRHPTYLPILPTQGHTDEVYTLSLSSDNHYLASAGKDRTISIWSLSPHSESFTAHLSGHKDSITSLSFRTHSHELYTASLDRTLKLYDVSQQSYVETLFGHQESVLGLSCLRGEVVVSAGGRDRTCRWWKIRDESQLVFRAGGRSKLREVLEGGRDSDVSIRGGEGEGVEAMEGSVEAVCMVDEHHFVSGGDSGMISLWNLGRKKPIFSVAVAHGFESTMSETEGEMRRPRWVTSLAALAYGDVFVSGSWDGQIRVWAITTSGGAVKSFRPLFSLPAQGVVNSLQIIQPPLNTLSLTTGGAVHTSAVKPAEWKRRSGLHSPSSTKENHEAEMEGEGEGLSRLERTKQNAPPIVIAALGKEHKLGRWVKVDEAKNGTLVIPLKLKRQTEEGKESRGVGRVNGEKKANFRLV